MVSIDGFDLYVVVAEYYHVLLYGQKHERGLSHIQGSGNHPVNVRRTLGIEPGTKVTFTAKKGMAHLQVEKQKGHATVADGAGMITLRAARCKARSLLAFDAASLGKRAK